MGSKIASEILFRKEVKQRAELWGKFVAIAKVCIVQGMPLI